MKSVYELVGRYFPLSGTTQKKTHFFNWNCTHTVVRCSGGTYLVPSCRICCS